jgi:outer membrane protein assembly factor BamA
LESNKTDYRKEDTALAFSADYRPYRHLATNCRLEELLVNVGPGTNKELPSTESVFGPSEAPGIDVQSNFLIGGCAAEMDFRDYPGDPHKGARAAGGYERYFAQEDDRFSFHRFSALAEQYIPFFNETHVAAIRVTTALTTHSKDQAVPFYLQSTLGGSNTLRGFQRYRFYDENFLLFNAEYRWEVSTQFDAALFYDYGSVFHRPGDIDLFSMESSAGFGLRLKDSNNVVARLDMGFSREGFQVWFKFGRVF